MSPHNEHEEEISCLSCSLALDPLEYSCLKMMADGFQSLYCESLGDFFYQLGIYLAFGNRKLTVLELPKDFFV